MNERGQISLLVIGFAVILLSLVAVVVDASQVVLLRRSLASLADGAALAAAQSLAVDALYSGQAVEYLPVDERRAGRAVQDYLRSSTIPLTAVDVRVAGEVVTVLVAAQAELPLVGAVVAGFEGTTVTARASARSPLS